MPELTPTDPVEVHFGDGKVRHLRYSLGSLRRLKKKFGESLINPDMERNPLSTLDEDKITVLVHEGLIEKDGMSADDVAELIHPSCLKSVIEAYRRAFTGAFPEKNATGQTETRETSPTGLESGPSEDKNSD